MSGHVHLSELKEFCAQVAAIQTSLDLQRSLSGIGSYVGERALTVKELRAWSDGLGKAKAELDATIVDLEGGK